MLQKIYPDFEKVGDFVRAYINGTVIMVLIRQDTTYFRQE